jgi:hypothetical protein
MSDRYTPNPLDQPAQMAERLRKLEQQVAQLQAAPLVGISAQILDVNGNPLVVLGTLPDGRRGLMIRNEATGFVLSEQTTEGWIAPHLIGDNFDPSGGKNVTNSSFSIVWGVEFGDALGPGVELQIPWSTEAGTTGEVFVSSNQGGQTSTLALGAGSSGFATVRWLHDIVVGRGPAVFYAQARRSAGSGNVRIGVVHGWVQNPDVCSTGGTWV